MCVAFLPNAVVWRIALCRGETLGHDLEDLTSHDSPVLSPSLLAGRERKGDRWSKCM